MEELISISSALLLIVVVTEIVFGAAAYTFEEFNSKVICDKHHDVFAQHIHTSEEVQLSCSSKCAQEGEDCIEFYYRPHQKLCKIAKLKREKSRGRPAASALYFHRKSTSVQQEKQVRSLLILILSY